MRRRTPVGMGFRQFAQQHAAEAAADQAHAPAGAVVESEEAGLEPPHDMPGRAEIDPDSPADRAISKSRIEPAYRQRADIARADTRREQHRMAVAPAARPVSAAASPSATAAAGRRNRAAAPEDRAPESAKNPATTQVDPGSSNSRSLAVRARIASSSPGNSASSASRGASRRRVPSLRCSIKPASRSTLM